MKVIWHLMVGALLVTTPAAAETVVLKNGSKITGNVVSRDSNKVQMDIGGVTVTYYMDEVDRIEGEVGVEVSMPETRPNPAQRKPVAQKPRAQAVSAEPSPQRPSGSPAAVSKPADRPGQMPASATKKELILKFLDVFGTKGSMQENFRQILGQMPAEQALELKTALDVDAVLEELVPIYEKHFTEDELRIYIEFYSSPEGQKLVRTIPLVMQESIQESADYLREIMSEPGR